MPQIQPMAMPVKAECPRASEKKLIRPVTIMVERMPNSGAISNIASNAFRMNSQRSSSRGMKSQNQYQMLITCHLPDEKSFGTLRKKEHHRAFLAQAPCGQSKRPDRHTAPNWKNREWSSEWRGRRFCVSRPAYPSEPPFPPHPHRTEAHRESECLAEAPMPMPEAHAAIRRRTKYQPVCQSNLHHGL